jgi:hypothetical protein
LSAISTVPWILGMGFSKHVRQIWIIKTHCFVYLFPYVSLPSTQSYYLMVMKRHVVTVFWPRYDSKSLSPRYWTLY